MQNLSKFVSNYPIMSFLFLTCLISWPPFIFYAASESGVVDFEVNVLFLALFAQFGPSIAAVCLIASKDGKKGLGKLWLQIRLWRHSWKVWFSIILLYPAISFVSLMAQLLLGAEINWQPDANVATYLSILVPGILIGIIFGGLSEELGWRGYLQPALEKHYSWPVAAVIIAIVWSIWHLEPDSVKAYFESGVEAFWNAWATPMLMRVLETMPFAILMVYFYRKTKHSLLVMMVMHSAANADISAGSVLWESSPFIYKVVFFALLWVIALVAIWSDRNNKVES